MVIKGRSRAGTALTVACQFDCPGHVPPFRPQRFIYDAEVQWDGAWRPVLVSLVGDEALVGMRLLAAHELRIAVVPGGSVEIKPLP